MIEPRTLKRRIDQTLVGAGLTRLQPGLWRWHGPEVDVGVGLGKSDFGRQHFLDIGFWIHDLPNDGQPAIHRAHMYFRLERIVPDLFELVRTSLNAAEATDDQLEALSGALQNTVIPLLKRCGSLAELRSLFCSTLHNQGLVLRKTREFLEPDQSAQG